MSAIPYRGLRTNKLWGDFMYDLIIKNGKIIDGTGENPYFADLAIKNGKIVRISEDITGSKKTIDASGLTVTPGFIDSHSHSDSTILEFPDQVEKAEQGITTSIGGQCGSTSAPIGIEDETYDVGSFGKSTEVFKTMGTFLDIAKDVPQGSNIAVFVGHSALRKAVIGSYNRSPSAKELEKMGMLLREGIEHGALGVSFGLIYPPCCFAKTDELIYLATVAAECGGMVSAHIRDEGYKLVEACEEFINIIKSSGARGVFSHHKAMYKENWGKVNITLEMIDKANQEGCDIYCDVYPYTASHTSLSARFIPKEYHSGGNLALVDNLTDTVIREKIKKVNIEKFGAHDDLNWVLITNCPAYPEYKGLRLSEIAKIHEKDVYDTIFDLLIESKNACSACYFLMCEEDLETVLSHPRAMICTDSPVRGSKEVYHPRLRGSFPRALGRYVRERSVVPLHEMIRKMTSMPATVYGLQGKGLIREGFDADICIFDADKIIDRSDFISCHERAEGLNYVLINGTIVVKNAVYNGTRAGKVLV